jgi:hypothetical protein
MQETICTPNEPPPDPKCLREADLAESLAHCGLQPTNPMPVAMKRRRPRSIRRGQKDGSTNDFLYSIDVDAVPPTSKK